MVFLSRASTLHSNNQIYRPWLLFIMSKFKPKYRWRDREIYFEAMKLRDQMKEDTRRYWERASRKVEFQLLYGLNHPLSSPDDGTSSEEDAL